MLAFFRLGEPVRLELWSQAAPGSCILLAPKPERKELFLDSSKCKIIVEEESDWPGISHMPMFVPITVARCHDWQLHQNHKKGESCYQKNEGREGR